MERKIKTGRGKPGGYAVIGEEHAQHGGTSPHSLQKKRQRKPLVRNPKGPDEVQGRGGHNTQAMALSMLKKKKKHIISARNSWKSRRRRGPASLKSK